MLPVLMGTSFNMQIGCSCLILLYEYVSYIKTDSCIAGIERKICISCCHLALDCITILFVHNDCCFSFYNERMKYGRSFSLLHGRFVCPFLVCFLFLPQFCLRIRSYIHAFIYSYILGRISILCVALRINRPVFFFTVAPCILKSMYFARQPMHCLLKIYIKVHINIAHTCFGGPL